MSEDWEMDLKSKEMAENFARNMCIGPGDKPYRRLDLRREQEIYDMDIPERLRSVVFRAEEEKLANIERAVRDGPGA